MVRRVRLVLTLAWLASAIAAEIRAGTVTLEPIQDTTLYEDSTGAVGNGTGFHFFAGRSGQNTSSIRRGLLAFDVAASIPAQSTIDSVRLVLRMSRASSTAPYTVRLHKVLAHWGEGSSDAAGEEGGGAPAQTGDATWIHTFFDTDLWATPGGDFVPTPSAGQLVGDLGSYPWDSTLQMVTDVQGWLDDPQDTTGWIVIGNEEAASSSKRFDSRNHPDPSFRPHLEIHFTPPTSVVAHPWQALKALYR